MKTYFRDPVSMAAKGSILFYFLGIIFALDCAKNMAWHVLLLSHLHMNDVICFSESQEAGMKLLTRCGQII
jgi:hypothetical protein